MDRRTLLKGTLGLGSVLSGSVSCAAARPTERTGPQVARATAGESPTERASNERIAAIEQDIGGRIGVYAFSPGHPQPLAHRSGERFAMCSTFKWALAAVCLQKAELDAARLDTDEHDAANDRALSLSDELSFDRSDLQEYAPATSALLQREGVHSASMSVRELAEAAVVVSDNTATNLLLEKVGGPSAVTAFFRSLADKETRLDRREPELNENAPGDPRDTTTPRAMAHALYATLQGGQLPDERARLLSSWLEQCQTGKSRLRAGFPADMRAGDKTGTGNRGACNDVAVLWPPSGSPWYVACYMSGSKASLAALSDAHARVGVLVAETLRQSTKGLAP